MRILQLLYKCVLITEIKVCRIFELHYVKICEAAVLPLLRISEKN